MAAKKVLSGGLQARVRLGPDCIEAALDELARAAADTWCGWPTLPGRHR